MTRLPFIIPLALVTAFALGGCALTSKADALSVRWFTPETIAARTTSSDASSDTPSPAAGRGMLELGRVTSGSDLREKIAYRDAAYEVGYYDDRRWTERPEVFVRHALARTLFEAHGFVRTGASDAPVLDVEVLGFEEIGGRAHVARVQLRMIVHDDRRALVERTLTVDKPIAPNGSFDAVIQAMAQALETAAEDVAATTERVVAAR